MTSYISKDKLERLKNDLKEMETSKRVEIAERLKKAKEYGDLSENFDYAKAKEDQNNLEKSIMELKDIIAESKVIEKSNNKDYVEVGHTVLLKNKNGSNLSLIIVGSHDANPKNNMISNVSPIGKAILGHRVGDNISVNTPNGVLEFKILKIE